MTALDLSQSRSMGSVSSPELSLAMVVRFFKKPNETAGLPMQVCYNLGRILEIGHRLVTSI